MKKYFTKLIRKDGDSASLMLCTHDIQPGDKVHTEPKGQAFKVVGPVSSKAFWVKEGDQLDEQQVIIGLYKVQVECATCGSYH